jgi:hypothetical protein
MRVLLCSVREGRIRFSGRAPQMLSGLWQMTPDAFIEAILDHLKSGGRVFRKFEQTGGRILPDKFQASIMIREPEDDDDYDDGTVYVEMIITEREVILIRDTHEHENRGRGMRLPF